MDAARPIIVKKKKGGGGDGHHGGAWKVAYADFVTAMMAFFLLMWLLNATSEEQRKGLADFFDPSLPISRNSAGGAGMLDGDTVFAEDQAAGSRAEGVRPKPTHAEPGQSLGDKDASPDLREDQAANADFTGIPGDTQTGTDAVTPGNAGADGQAADGDKSGTGQGEGQDERLARIAESLVDRAVQAGESGLLDHFALRMTPDGLVIEIVDIQNEALFQSGDADPEPILRQLTAILVPVLAQTTNEIAVVGHTDARPFGSGATYSNWELSADRANAARRLLGAAGLPPERIVRVTGKAATNPIVQDPNAPQNRRIAITLLREGRSNP